MICGDGRHGLDPLNLLTRKALPTIGKVWTLPVSMDLAIFLLTLLAQVTSIGILMGCMVISEEASIHGCTQQGLLLRWMLTHF